MTASADGIRRTLPAAVTVLATLVVLGPLYLGRGIALRGDMVFVPDQPWKDAWLGLDGSVPRAVPMDALVSLVDEVVPGELLQRLLLTTAFLAGGLGIARLAGRAHILGQVAAVLVYLWNPWVHERLAIGQWPMVLGYGLLPWVVGAAARVREDVRGGWSGTFLLLVMTAVCAPSAGLLGALVATAVILPGRSWRRTGSVVLLAVAANAPWWLPAVLGPAIHPGTHQFDDFAARAESPLGPVASLLSMGGIWKTSVVPPERTEAVVIAVAGMVALALLIGFRYALSMLRPPTAVGVALAAGVALLLALLPSAGSAAHALDALARSVPAVAILRDSHRYLAPFGLVLALGAAALVDRLVTRRGHGSDVAVAAVLVLAPVVLLPSMAWGLAGQLRPVEYPSDWSRAARYVASHPGATVVLPWTGSYRGYAWNDRRAVLDPAPRFLPGDVLVDDRVFLGHDVLPTEDPFLARVGESLVSSDPSTSLRGLGVRWVLVEKANGVRPSDVPAGEVVLDGRWLTLVDMGPTTRDVRHLRTTPPAGIVRVADVGVLLAACVSIAQLAAAAFVTRRYCGVWSVQRVLGRGRQGGSTT